MPPDSGRPPAAGDGQQIRRALEQSNPDLYRDLALYLQVLREILATSVDQVCFHLATQLNPERYAALAPERRRDLHRRLKALVQRCGSLLTVEQIGHLALRLEREQLDRRLESRRHLLERLSLAAGERQRSPGAGLADNEVPVALPEGSVELGLELPLGGGWLDWSDAGASPLDDGYDDTDAGDTDAGDADVTDEGDGDGAAAADLHLAAPDFAEGLSAGGSGEPGDGPWFLEPASPAAGEDTSAADSSRDDGVASADGETTTPLPSGGFAGFLEDFAAAMGLPPPPEQPAGSSHPPDPDRADPGDPAKPGQRSSDPPPWPRSLRTERRLAAAASGLAGGDPDAPQTGGASGATADADGGTGGEDADRLAAFRLPEEGGLLPRDPILLLAWLEGFDQALARRLRNLSHAINSELLRCGLVRALLPVSLLDAALNGQFESQSAQPNLLRMQLPLGIGGPEGRGEIAAVLLRCVDLELEQPRLRSVRRSLQQRRQETRRMAHQYHRLQRRLLARKAEVLWLQDIRSTRLDPHDP